MSSVKPIRFSSVRRRLDATRTRLTNLAAEMANAQTQLPPTPRTERTKLFLAINLVVFIADYDKSVAELQAQRTALVALQAEVNR